MSDEAFARRFYADRSELLALGVPLAVAARRLHRRGAVHAPAGALLPAAAQPQRRRARRAVDRRAPAGRPVRVRRAAAARAAEPRARPPEPVLRRRARGVRAAARERLHGRGRRAPAEARDRHLEAAHGRLPLLGDLLRRGGDAHGRPLQPVPHERPVVRHRPRPRPRRRAHVPARPRARRRALRDPPRARLPRARRSSTRAPTATARRGSSARATSRRRSWSSPTPPGWSSAPSASTARSSTATTARCCSRRTVADWQELARLADRPRRPGLSRLAARARRARGSGARARRRRRTRASRRPHAVPLELVDRGAAARARRVPGHAGALRGAPGDARRRAGGLRRAQGRH